MATIYPFRAIRYADSLELDRVVAPPYDVISPEQRAELASRDARNAIHIELPEAEGSETKYQTAARKLASWRQDGSLMQDQKSCFYRYRQTFTPPGTESCLSRDGFFAAVRIEDYDRRIVLPHEKTLDKPKADRLDLIRATQMNISPVFGFFSDPAGVVLNALDAATQASSQATIVRRFTDEYGIDHEMRRLDDAIANSRVVTAFSDVNIYIADGHHRYGTAINYRNECREKVGSAPQGAPWERVLMYLAPATQMTVLAYHRMASNLPGFQWAKAREALVNDFQIEQVADLDAALKALNATPVEQNSFCLVVQGEPGFHLLKAKDPAAIHRQLPAGLHPSLQKLDVTVLHEFLLAKELGIDQNALARETHLSYTPDARKVAAEVTAGRQQLGCLLRPTLVEQVQEVSNAGQVMPQKSTYFYPKLPTGIVFNPVYE